MPLYTALAMGLFFAGLGLPGLCGFIGEVFVVLSVWNFSKLLAILSAFVVILTAGYILWAIQRVYLGPEYKGPHGEELSPITLRELSVAVPLLILAIWFGVYPQTVLKYMNPTIDQQVERLAEWSETYSAERTKEAEAALPAAAAVPTSSLPVTSKLSPSNPAVEAAAVILPQAEGVLIRLTPQSSLQPLALESTKG
jgi:NADH-quinone oxidoreductase subunit M